MAENSQNPKVAGSNPAPATLFTKYHLPWYFVLSLKFLGEQDAPARTQYSLLLHSLPGTPRKDRRADDGVLHRLREANPLPQRHAHRPKRALPRRNGSALRNMREKKPLLWYLTLRNRGF